MLVQRISVLRAFFFFFLQIGSLFLCDHFLICSDVKGAKLCRMLGFPWFYTSKLLQCLFYSGVIYPPCISFLISQHTKLQGYNTRRKSVFLCIHFLDSQLGDSRDLVLFCLCIDFTQSNTLLFASYFSHCSLKVC